MKKSLSAGQIWCLGSSICSVVLYDLHRDYVDKSTFANHSMEASLPPAERDVLVTLRLVIKIIA